MCKSKHIIGKNIRRGLKNKGISLVDAAKKLGISKQALWYNLSEKEDRNWVIWEVRQYSEVLGIKESTIMNGVEEGIVLGEKKRDREDREYS